MKSFAGALKGHSFFLLPLPEGKSPTSSRGKGWEIMLLTKRTEPPRPDVRRETSPREGNWVRMIPLLRRGLRYNRRGWCISFSFQSACSSSGVRSLPPRKNRGKNHNSGALHEQEYPRHHRPGRRHPPARRVRRHHDRCRRRGGRPRPGSNKGLLLGSVGQGLPRNGPPLRHKSLSQGMSYGVADGATPEGLLPPPPSRSLRGTMAVAALDLGRAGTRAQEAGDLFVWQGSHSHKLLFFYCRDLRE